MSVFTELEAKLADVKGKVEGDLHVLVTKLESIFQHIHLAPVEDVVKEAVAADIHAAATQVETVATTLRSEVTDAVTQAVKPAAPTK